MPTNTKSQRNHYGFWQLTKSPPSWKRKKSRKQVLINPTITRQEGSVTAREGCLSLPDFTANVTRARAIGVAALNEEGTLVSLETEDLEARVILHECDHLDGILFLDRVASLRTDVFRRKRY